MGTVLVTVRGELGARGAKELGRWINRVLAESPERVVIDLTNVAELDRDGAAALHKAKQRAERKAVQLLLTSRTRVPLDALDSVGLAQEFTVV
jgi:anti-anti-sigma factor